MAEYTALVGNDPAPAAQVSYLTQDHLGSPRVVTNQNGEVIKRTDWMAFGEEVEFNKRTSGLGYDEVPETRKGYTGYEKDEESGLDFAQARYYNPKHGRFTSVDPLTASANVKNPQTFNRYSYALNSPYKFTDPLGLIAETTGACGQCGNYYYVDGSSFSGQDSDLAQIFEDMAVDSFLADLSIEDVQWGGGAAESERDVLYNSLVAVASQRTDREARNIAVEMLASKLTIDVASKSSLTTSATTGISNVSGLNAAIKSGSLTERQALGYMTISIAREEFSNPVDIQGSLQSNLVHEGKHATSYARILSGLASGDSKRSEDITIYVDELQASRASATFLSNHFQNFGKHSSVGQLDSAGNVIDKVMKNKAQNSENFFKSHNIKTVHDWLKSLKVVWK